MTKASTARGFTLIELMVVVAILAIIAAVGYPAYVDQIRDARRADCRAALVSFAGAMERHFTENNSYQGAAAGGGNTGAPDADVFSSTCPLDGNDAFYNLTIDSATTTQYELRAAPTGPQSDDECGTLTIDNTGSKGVENADGGLTAADCW